MLLKKITKLSQVLALMAIVLGVGAFYQAEAAAAGNVAAAFDDDDDRKKNRSQRGDQRVNRGGERGRDSQRDSDRESRRQQAQSDQNSRRQQRSSDNESRRQQQRSDENGRRQQQQSDNGSRRQQEWSDQNSRRQQWESDRRSRQQLWESDQRSRRQQYERDRGNRGRDQNRYRGDRRRNNDRPVGYVAPGTIFGQRWNGRPVSGVDNRRLVRDEQRFIKEQTKAQRRYQQDQRRSARTQYNRYPAPVYQYDNNYYANQPDYNAGSSWKSQILPVLIANIFGGNSFGNSDAFDGGYPAERYARTNVDPYRYQVRQPAYAYEPSYKNYGYDDQSAYNQPGFDSGSILGSLPIAEIIQQYTGENEFVSGLIGSFLTQGYDHGYLAGQSARETGYSDAAYNDPYAYQNSICDPYSVSVGENRRYLSEGYEQGFRDALAGNVNYDGGNSTGSDLVGVLLNSMLSGV